MASDGNAVGSTSVMGGFSLSNLSGPGGVAAAIVAGCFILLGGLYWLFRDVAQF
jgi:hypothetical protein